MIGDVLKWLTALGASLLVFLLLQALDTDANATRLICGAVALAVLAIKVR